ncbi:hypothetical protein [Pseudomonas syringae]|uniref:Uncharacterized protein n=1 Tax=Pseudomonas syringae pv. actinidiae TaxID=103796 RepID=A0A2P0QF21_PSESF|nr:hypothetical protein [Pseudomonas syringae]APQ06964.1 hypothetical protein PsaNZ47_29935 [Pseudomonas syringae pv. actinidiae]ARO44942.1 hypothetical protein [Pseudomonas syringae pv. actinidiae]ARO45045.1 hypothetical protein [Pseudomonas syringae pv. actinidiae]ARO45138.1 hypothetical protein [Pseudomonas syringae pv. actinidiae]MDU8389134.1 hypothetical protein [Pseudomonas syringae pv. actinidiae]
MKTTIGYAVLGALFFTVFMMFAVGFGLRTGADRANEEILTEVCREGSVDVPSDWKEVCAKRKSAQQPTY